MAAIYDQILIFSSSGSYKTKFFLNFIFYVEATEHIESDFEFREKIIKFVVKIIFFPSFIKHLFSKSLHLSLNVQANNTSSDSTYQFS